MWRFKQAHYLFIISLLPGFIFAQEKKEKRINRTFDTGRSTELKVSNEFGRVHIDTWDKDQIEVEVLVWAMMRNEAKSQEFIDNVEIEIFESTALVSLETSYGIKMNHRKGDVYGVDYSISMPSSNPLEVTNKFGDIYVGDLSGDLEVHLKYGNMKGDKLTGNSEIELGFGGATIEELGTSEVDVKYSHLSIGKTKNIELEQQYSEVEIDMAQLIDLRSRYGELELGIIEGVEGSVGFTDFEIEEVLKSVDLEMEYVGGFEISNIRKEFEEIRLDARYTSMELGFEKGAGGEFEGNLRYSDFDTEGADLDLNYIVEGNTRREYKGKLGEGGASKIRVDSDYGDLRIIIDN